MSNEKTKAVLNQTVADLSQFATIIHQVHWYMRGEEFLTLHPRMDQFMDEINDQLDEIAERLITVGGAPYSTLEEFAQNSKLATTTGSFEVTIPEHMERLVDGYRYIADLYQVGIDTAAEEGDAVTEDIYTTLKAPIEKNIWMLQAKLGKAPNLDRVNAK